MNVKLFCPACDSQLVVTHQERYQELVEHVSDPNGAPSLKDGYQCMDSECIAHQCNVSWIEDGDYYFGQRPNNISYIERKNALEGKHGTAFAVGSWNFYYELGKQAVKKKTWKINLYWYKFVIIPKEKGWDYGVEERHQPHFWRRKIEIWKKDGEHSYVNVIPFWRMTKFCVKKFNQAYKNWKETDSKSSFKEAYDEAMGLAPWGNVDDRFYARVSKVWIQTFYPNKVKELIKNKDGKGRI